jgi:uncharacterized glyoxalase superfamily protein PhnB/DNA-binding XRE family transcriptional regulator
MEEKMIGEKIRSLRERKAWTQEALAERAELSARTVQRAEEGAMAAQTRTAIASALGVAVESLAPDRKPPEGWPRITPTLFYEDSRAAVSWLEKAFGFYIRERVTNEEGQVIHSELVLGGGVIMCGNVNASPSAGPRFASPKSTGKNTQSLYVFVDDLDAHYARAKAAGATILTEPETSYGHRRYRALDLEGHQWCFATAAVQA